MIVGLGCDIVNIERINKSAEFLAHFRTRILGSDEQKELDYIQPMSQKDQASLLAKYYAGKEAFAKALGTGFRDGIFLKNIQILHDDLGKPYLTVSDQALQTLQKIAPQSNLLISLSDDYPYAQAVVIIEKI